MKFLRELLERRWEDTGLKQHLDAAPTSPMSRAVSAQRQAPHREYVGSGAMAYVDKSTSPHEMDNVQRMSAEADGTSTYHRKIAENPKIQNNPYLPKIRAQQTQHGISYSVLERLVNLDSKVGNYEVLEALYDKMFAIPWEQTELGKEAMRMQPEDRLSELRNEICYSIEENVAGSKGASKIKDPELKQAVKFLQSINKEAGMLDLHDGNFMLRMTGNMPQLVITDPFA